MIIVSYDISSNELRSEFSKMLIQNGAIRLQYSVYEFNNTKRWLDIVQLKIEAFAKYFGGGDSVLVFDVANENVKKYGNAIHRDADIVYF